MAEEPVVTDQKECEKNDRGLLNLAMLTCGIVAAVATILMLISLGMLGLSVAVAHFNLKIAWLQSAHHGWFSEQGHFFHVFLYNLLMLVVLTIIANVAVRLLKKLDKEAIVQVRFIFLYIFAMASAEIVSFILFIHTVSEVVPK